MGNLVLDWVTFVLAAAGGLPAIYHFVRRFRARYDFEMDPGIEVGNGRFGQLQLGIRGHLKTGHRGCMLVGGQIEIEAPIQRTFVLEFERFRQLREASVSSAVGETIATFARHKVLSANHAEFLDLIFLARDQMGTVERARIDMNLAIIRICHEKKIPKPGSPQDYQVLVANNHNFQGGLAAEISQLPEFSNYRNFLNDGAKWELGHHVGRLKFFLANPSRTISKRIGFIIDEGRTTALSLNSEILWEQAIGKKTGVPITLVCPNTP